jgi:cyclic pyranopterin phosphate synthase
MDVGNRNAWRPDQVVPSRELLARVQARWPVSPRASHYRGEVAERYVYDDGAGEIGFISSVSSPFCGNCSRARLSSDGMFYTCLFATHGTDLRAPLRAGASDDELAAIVRNIWTARGDRYSEQRVELRMRGQAAGKVEMNYIGG